MKKHQLILSVCFVVLFSSCIKELIEEELKPTIEDNIRFQRENSLFGFDVNTSDCRVDQSIENTVDSSFFTYYMAGGLKQVLVGKEGSKVEYAYDIDGRLQVVDRKSVV